jgi:OOP family OmpA-OmpF porin
MRISSLFTILGAFLAAAMLSLITAYFSVQLIEDASKLGVREELIDEGLTWAEVDTDGLQVFLIGTAPDEARRFQALSIAGRVVDAARLIDQMLVEDPDDIAPPRFSLELLRNDAGISVIGLVPATTDAASLIEGFVNIAGEDAVSDFLETADYPAPEGWEEALSYATTTLRDLPRSKISVEAGRVAIKAMTDSPEARRRLETDLTRRAPSDLRLALELSAPRPVISPFALRFVIDEDGASFDACSADTEEARERILRAAGRAGLEGKTDCVLGLGVPSRRWADAADLAISKLAELGQGTVTFTNADITLVAVEGTSQLTFDRIVGELEAGLPPVFVLTPVLPKAPENTTDEGPPEFFATLSLEGAVQLRGRLGSEISRQTVDSFARARFGSTAVYTAARIDETLPSSWSVRALAAIEAMALLENGSVSVTPENVVINGVTGNKDANAEIATLFATKLGDQATFDIEITYDRKLDPSLGIPKPPECVAMIKETIGTRKISFEPGSTTPDASTNGILDDIAPLLTKCGDIPLEIGGHTDSQGRETMNQELSRDRAQAILDALRLRRVPTGSYTVEGYGESEPIATNDTEEGREGNRRIEFKLISPAEQAAEGAADE